MQSYDVIIIGAGPAGLSCAQSLSKSRKKVLLIEKQKQIGPKICAGCITKKDLDYLKLPPSMIEKKFKRLIIHTPHHQDIIEEDEAFLFTVDRKKLGQWQLNKLKNTDTLTGAAVTNIADDHVAVNKKKFGYKYLVGADGSASVVRRHLKLPFNCDLAMHYLVPKQKFDDIEIFFDSSHFQSWYAWIIPHKGYVSIGCGCNPRDIPAKAMRQNFDTWLKEHSIKVGNAAFLSHPINIDYHGHEFGNTYLVGDAAGLASGLTGEGIYPALVSGEEIAKKILNRNHVPLQLDEVLAQRFMHNRLMDLLQHSGEARDIEYELLGLMLKSKFMDKRFLEFIM